MINQLRQQLKKEGKGKNSSDCEQIVPEKIQYREAAPNDERQAPGQDSPKARDIWDNQKYTANGDEMGKIGNGNNVRPR